MAKVSSKLLDRAFNKAHSTQNNGEQDPTAAQPRVRTQVDEEADLRQLTSKMDANDAVSRMLLAQRDGDYFRLLELPAPEADELGRPCWQCTPAEVSKAYRRLSTLVHPDKNPGKEARVAFEALNQAYKALRDPGQLEELLNRAADDARQRRAAAEAAATPSERVALYTAKKERAKTLQQQQGTKFQAEIQRQMQIRQQRAKRKREIVSSYRRDEGEMDGGDAGHGSEKACHPVRQKILDDGSDDDGHSLAASHLTMKGRNRPKAIF